jgi:hypothetical protein
MITKKRPPTLCVEAECTTEVEVTPKQAFDDASDEWKDEFIKLVGPNIEVDYAVEAILKEINVHGNYEGLLIIDRFLANGWKLEKVKL